MGGAWLNEVATRAAAQNEQYLEIMNTPTFDQRRQPRQSKIALALVCAERSVASQRLCCRLRKTLLAAGLQSMRSPVDTQEFADWRKAVRNADRALSGYVRSATVTTACGGPDSLPLPDSARLSAATGLRANACSALRSPAADPDVVGLNFVMPEDSRISMQ
jgi:adenosine deaminase